MKYNQMKANKTTQVVKICLSSLIAYTLKRDPDESAVV